MIVSTATASTTLPSPEPRTTPARGCTFVFVRTKFSALLIASSMAGEYIVRYTVDRPKVVGHGRAVPNSGIRHDAVVPCSRTRNANGQRPRRAELRDSARRSRALQPDSQR